MVSLKELSPNVRGDRGAPAVARAADQNTTIQASRGSYDTFSLFLDFSQAIYFCSNRLVYTFNVETKAAHTPNELTLANHQLWEGSNSSSSKNESYAMERWLSQSEREEGVVVYSVRSFIM